jgi:Domain of unknown function (DUF4388)
MSQRRGTITDKLLSVIQVLQLGKKTGHLLVERGEGMVLEEGEIIFSNGQVIRARVDKLQGQQAMNKLSTWSTCRFIFIPETQTSLTKQSDTAPLLSVKSTKPLQDSQPRLPSVTPTRRNTDEIEQVAVAPRPNLAYAAEQVFQLLDQAGLSRSHRRLFLLDGQRTLVELVRLSGRSAEEVQRLLQDLAHIGVIL